MRKGFEPPVRANVHLFSRQAPSTTRTPHRIGLQIYEIFFNLQSLPLLEPFIEVFFRVEIVDGSAQPGKEEKEDDGDHLSGHGNLFLKDVDRSDDADDFADEDDGFIKHDSDFKGFLIQKYKKDGGMQALFS